ncbi:MAG: hypothetical protein HC869_23605, partial [Rhodospirillales bacterium]|nr:hypothetical protein [Rhodospirillales bacterium]
MLGQRGLPSPGRPFALVKGRRIQAGAARDIVRVRVCYLHKSFNPGLGLNLQKTNAGALRMISTSI